MSKLGAVAILAMATIASAQDCVGDFTTGDSRCHGPEDSDKRACCEGLECQRKDQWYGQCRPIGSEILDGWEGTILNYGGENAGGDNGDNGEDDNGDGDMDEDMGDDEDMDENGMSDDMSAGAPAGADSQVMYMAIPGKDYIPTSPPAVPNLVNIEDIPPEQGAKMVADQEECEEFCTATEGCNAASYYNEAVGGNNCWLKIIADVCEVPSDALDDTNATFLLKFDDACMDDAMAPVGLGGIAPAAAPMSDVDAVDEETRDSDSGADASGTATPDTVDDDDGDTAGSILSVRSAAIAMAVAGAAAFL